MEESKKKQQQQHDANEEEREPLVGGESGGVGPAVAFAASAKASGAAAATTTTTAKKSVNIQEIQIQGGAAVMAEDSKQHKAKPATSSKPHSSIWSSASSALWDDDSETTEESLTQSKNIASDVSLLSGLLGRDGQSTALDDVVGTYMRRAAYVGLSIWSILLVVTYLVAKPESYQYLKPREQAANAILLTLLVGVNINRLGPLFITERNLAFMKSGAMSASFAVQFIAIASNAALLFLRTPIIIDPTTGLRFHLVRWCEWTALAFIMCSLTEGIDLPLERSEGSTATSWIFAWCVCLSTFCGYLFPFCPNTTIWMIVMTVSWTLYLALPIRFVQKRRRLFSLKGISTAKDRSSIEKEHFERAQYSYRLLILCNIVWTILAAFFTINCYMYKYGASGSIWNDDAFVLMSENMCEALSKVGYLHILTQIHEQLFDDVAKTVRILQDLCSYMSAVWDVSSDVVIICSKSDEIVNAAVSPAFLQLGKGYTTGKANQPGNPQITLIMEVDPYEGTYNTCEVDLSKPMTRQQANSLLKSCRSGNNGIGTPFTKDSEKGHTVIFQKNLKVLADLVGDACAYAIPGGTNKQVLAKDFYCIENGTMKHGLSCEAQIVNLKGKAVLIVLRDITNRIKLHKAESRLRKIDPNKEHYE